MTFLVVAIKSVDNPYFVTIKALKTAKPKCYAHSCVFSLCTKSVVLESSVENRFSKARGFL